MMNNTPPIENYDAFAIAFRFVPVFWFVASWLAIVGWRIPYSYHGVLAHGIPYISESPITTLTTYLVWWIFSGWATDKYGNRPSANRNGAKILGATLVCALLALDLIGTMLLAMLFRGFPATFYYFSSLATWLGYALVPVAIRYHWRRIEKRNSIQLNLDNQRRTGDNR